MIPSEANSQALNQTSHFSGRTTTDGDGDGGWWSVGGVPVVVLLVDGAGAAMSVGEQSEVPCTN